MRRVRRTSAGLALLSVACAHPKPEARADDVGTLRAAFAGTFRLGAALNARVFAGIDTLGAALVKAQFNSISPENVLKWEVVHPRPTAYDFTQSDRYVAFGQANDMFIVGHTLVWHNQTPRWVFQDAEGKPLTRDALLARMRDHIRTVVGRYRGRISGWDVVNEALNEDGTLRRSPWLMIIGDDYIAKAFEFAREADPAAELYYNDYDLDVATKRDGAVRLVKALRARGVAITAVGSQTHDRMIWENSPAQHDSTIAALAATGVQVNISELDVDVLPPAIHDRAADSARAAQQQGRGRGAALANLNPYVNGLPASVQQALATRYADLFTVFLKHRDVIGRVTFWGVTDADSWLNNWPARGRTSYPLLFDRQGQPKPAFEAVLRAARRARAASKSQ